LLSRIIHYLPVCFKVEIMTIKNTRNLSHEKQKKAVIIPFPLERTRMPSNNRAASGEQKSGKICLFLGIRYEHPVEEKPSSIRKRSHI